MRLGWWIIPYTLLGLALWVLMFSWAFGETLTYRWHPGGYTHVTLHEIHMARKRGLYVRLECDNTCYSAGTFWLRYVAEGHGCVGRNSCFGFHLDSNGGDNRLLYPRGLRQWVKHNVNSRKFVYLTGRQVAALEPRIEVCA